MVSEEQILLGAASDRRPVPLVGGLGSDERFYYAIYYATYYATYYAMITEHGNISEIIQKILLRHILIFGRISGKLQKD